ncbi:unnamed protein product [Caenorhabditis bovis]|uniref:Uncharacterized protein n=1 Tax=Caenorhabditis bovis TaxID=2654633 RepID=A0A8S1F4X9_9PELO|nr:unnamed protein product [Caenorhabditis bovis]
MRCLLIYLSLLTIFQIIESQLHDLEVSTQPSWAPTGRLHQFNGFATPRPSLLPENAQMVYASVWAGWSAWSFCNDGKRIRVRACNTVRGFRCLGPNQETEPCDPSTSPIRGHERPNTVANDYDVIDPWQEDRIEALRQLYPDESIDEKLNRLPEHERQRLLSSVKLGELAAPQPSLISHELLHRPTNENTGAPGSTPERMFGAKSFAVKTGNEPLKLPDFPEFDLKDISDITKEKFDDLKEVEPARKGDSNSKEFLPFLERDNESSRENKARGEGTFSKKKSKTKTTTPSTTTTPEITTTKSNDEEFPMDGPMVAGPQFTNDVFGSIEDLIMPKRKLSTHPPTTTTKRIASTARPIITTPITTTTRKPTTTIIPKTTIAATIRHSTTPKLITTTTRQPIRVTPRHPVVFEDDSVELVTPGFEKPTTKLMLTTAKPKSTTTGMNPEVINFFNEELLESIEVNPTTKKPYKFVIHEGEVTVRTTTTTVAPKPLPEEISLDTLHALDWMLANMTKAAEQGQNFVNGNELRLDSSPESLNAAKIAEAKTKKKRGPKRNRTKLTKVVQLHYGDVEPTGSANKFPKFRNKHARRAKVFGIRTANSREVSIPVMNTGELAYSNDENKQKQESLMEDISDIQDLMEQLDERIESRSAVSEPISFPIQKHVIRLFNYSQ